MGRYKKEVISPDFQVCKPQIDYAIGHFNRLGHKVGKGKRNMVKHIVVDDMHLNVKSFKVPNIINKLVYRYFRKSKAQRSYEYARYLLQRDIGTPLPVAYMEERSFFSLGRSYYISIHLKEDLTFRTLIDDPGLQDRELILRQFMHFTHRLHENNILFLDHSPGNTLIVKRDDGDYDFYLVDLNRMKLHCRMDAEKRIKNLARLSATDDMIEIMSDEYARITGLEQAWVYDRIRDYTRENLQRRARQKKINKNLGKYRQ